MSVSNSSRARSAPEKARRESSDERSDQYSLGCTLWHALIGRRPFDGPKPVDMVLARMNREPPLLRDEDSSISPRTSAVVRRMMDLDPDHRYPTYEDLLVDLHEALAQLPAWQQQETGEPLEVADRYQPEDTGDRERMRLLRDQVRERLQGLVSEGVRRRRGIFFG